MTNYNDGNWHIWHGGECPVHPKSIVEAVWHDPNQEKTGIRNGTALGGAWRDQIVKFRVINEYREPREFWIKTEDCTPIITRKEPRKPHSYIHVREVTE